MRILNVIHRLDAGGGPTSTVSLVNALSRVDGLDVHLAARPGPTSRLIDGSVAIHGITASNPFSFIRQLSRVLREVEPDLLHVHGSRLAVQAWVSVRLARWRGPLVSTRHSHGFSYVPDRLAARLLDRICTHTVTLTGVEHESLVANGTRESRVSVIPHAIDLERLAARCKEISKENARRHLGIDDASGNVISVAARLVEGKGLSAFITVISQLRAAGVGVTGVIAGAGPLEESLRAQADNISHGGAVRFVGYQAQIEQVLAASDMVLFMSEAEVLPMFVIESMACGVPVVGRRIPSMEELVDHGRTGILVESEHDAAREIKELIESPLRLQELATAARESVERFSSAATTRRLVELYESLLTPCNPNRTD